MSIGKSEINNLLESDDIFSTLNILKDLGVKIIKKDKKWVVYGNGSNIRDWIFVNDHCDAVRLALEKGKSGESYNISANNEIDNLTVIKKILELMNKSEDLIEFVEDRPGHDLRYSMNSDKTIKNLDWKIKSDFESGLKTTIGWYLQNPEILNDITKALEPTPWKNSN